MDQADLEGGDAITYKWIDFPVPVLAPVHGSLYTDAGRAFARRH